MSRTRKLFPLASIVLVAMLVLLWVWRERQTQRVVAAVLNSPYQTNGAPLTVARAIKGLGVVGFERVTQPRQFTFPADHGPHPEYHTEWWYYTGNLYDADGRQYGYQLTFFRQGLTPTPAQRASRWAARDVYLAHFGLTDAAGKQFYAADRLNRAATTCCAGASAEPYHIFAESWSAEGTGETARLRASDKNIAIDLQVRAVKPPTLQGDNGFARKAAAEGSATY